MILAVDVGNTHIVLGALCRDSDEITFTAQISSDRGKTADEYAVLLQSLFALNGFDPDGRRWRGASSPRWCRG